MTLQSPAAAIPNWLADELNTLRTQLIDLHCAARRLSDNLEREDNDFRHQVVPDVVQTAEHIETLLQQTERLFCEPLIMDLLGAHGSVIN